MKGTRKRGLDYRGTRFYDCDIGRFLSLDTLAVDFAGWSPYNYVLGNPIYFVDPSGKKAEDYYVFDENGKFQRKEENDEPDQIVVENSKTSERRHIAFNDPKNDVALLESAIEFHGDDIPLLYFVGESEIDNMMKDSDVSITENSAVRAAWVAKGSIGGKMDFSVYQLPLYVAREVGSPYRWNHKDLGLEVMEKKGVHFLY